MTLEPTPLPLTRSPTITLADDDVLPLDNDTPLDVAPTAESNRGPAAGERESFTCARRALEVLLLVLLLTPDDRSSERDLEN